MAKIRNSNPKQNGGGYERLVGDADMASIFTKAQSTVISNGTELEKIITGFKSVFTIDEVMTGREFCNILGIDYDAIVKMRRDDTADNFKYVVEKMFEIKEVRSQFSEKHRKHITENDFYDTDGIKGEDD